MGDSYERGVDGEAFELLARPVRRSRRAPYFEAYWIDLSTGARRRATRLELREAYRLLAKHRDIWQGG